MFQMYTEVPIVIMSFRKWVGLLLVVFVYAFVAADELSTEFEMFLKDNDLTVASDTPFYKNFKRSFKGLKKTNKELEKMKKEKKNYYKELREIGEKYLKTNEKMPYVYLMCAMQFMKFQGAKIFYNVTGVGNLRLYETDEMRQWPERIQKIRIDYDEYDEANPCLMYPSSSSHQIMKKEDNTSYNQWLQFVTEDPVYLLFENKKNIYKEDKWPETQKNWRRVALYLQGNLTKYYNQLDENERSKRYNNDKKVFLESFSAIIQRGFRLSCYFSQDMQPQLLEKLHEMKYDNGTNIFLEVALIQVHHRWYFPEEHIDMYNILINSTTSDSNDIHNMFASVNVTLLNRQFILPGMDTCGRAESVTTAAFKHLKPKSEV